MGTGYTRTNNSDIQPDQAVTAEPLKAEFDAVEAAYDGSTGHAHDGSLGNGPLIDVTSAITGVVEVANGGTDSATASGARTSLGVEIGTDVAAHTASLASIGGVANVADEMLYTTGVDTWASTALTAAGRAILDDVDNTAQRTTLGLGTSATRNVGVVSGTDVIDRDAGDTRYLNATSDLSDLNDAATARTNLGVSLGSDVQAYDQQLNEIAGITFSAGGFIRSDGVNMIEHSSGTTGRALLSDETASSGRTTLGLGSVSTLDTGTAAGEVRTNTQNDSTYQPLDADLTTLAGLTVTAEHMYARASTGNLTIIPVLDFMQSALGSADEAAFRAAIGVTAGGTELQAAANLSDVNDVPTSRSNLGLGTAAVLNQGTGAGDLINTGDADGRYIGVGGTLAIANGGTGATTASAARTNLGLGDASTYNVGTSGGVLMTVTTADGKYLNETSNLSDLDNASTARSNLGLGTMATQAASAVAITGGTGVFSTITGTTYNGLPAATTSVEGIVQLTDSISTTSSVLGATATAVKSAYDLANAAAPSSHTHSGADITSGVVAEAYLPNASTGAQGVVQLSTSTSSTSTTLAATASAVKSAYDLANGKADASHSHTEGDLPNASTSAQGVVQLSTSVSSTSTTLAATPSAVKTVNDALAGKAASSHSHTAGDLPALSSMNGTLQNSQMVSTSMGARTLTVQSGGSASGGSNGDVFFIY